MKNLINLYENYHWVVATAILILALAAGLGLVFGVMCLQAWLVMLLWNWVAVSLFGAPIVKFWTAFGLTWLCGLLFKSNIITKKSKD